MKLPPMKAPASLRIKPGPGRLTPTTMGHSGVLMFGPFGDCAFLLAHLEPAGGDEFWIESLTGTLKAEQVKAAYKQGLIERVN
jgi:hypothetical protein